MGVCVFRVGSWGFMFFTAKAKRRAETCLPRFCWGVRGVRSPGSHGAGVTNSVCPSSLGDNRDPRGDSSHCRQCHRTRLEQSLDLEPGLKVSGEWLTRGWPGLSSLVSAELASAAAAAFLWVFPFCSRFLEWKQQMYLYKWIKVDYIEIVSGSTWNGDQ